MSDSESGMSQSDIAIVGMALRVPGARSVEEFWSNLRQGVESIVTRTPEQLIAAGEQPDTIRRKNYVPRTAELPGLENFDAEFFGFSPKEAAIMDPQHRQFLECAWEALEDSTRTPERISGPIGVFGGCGMGSYFYFNVLSHRSLVDKVGMFLLRHTGNDKDFLVTRVSHLFDLHGPSVNVQTACSTSLVAVHYACQSLLSGECEMALAGGVTIDLPHRRGYLYQDGEVLSTDGHCRAFDHRASGTVFGSGVGVVVLRRLADALADGDPIHAVIKGTAVNNDGASKAGYLAPSVTGQSEAIVEAQTLAGVDASSIGYVECHGTGTYLGDPIEIEALTQAFRQTSDKQGFCRIGSVKTNIGHLDTAAGVASLIKAALIVKHGEIPPTLGFEKPNPAIPFATSPFVVNDRLTSWPASQTPRRAGINSLGVGGTNAHAVIEEPPRRPAAPRAEVGPQVLVLSAKNRKALDDAGRRLARHMQANPDLALQDVAHTLLEGRRHFEHRRVAAVADRNDAIALLAEPDKHRMFTHARVEGNAEAVFLFPGGGAQYPHMARALYRDEPTFRRVVDEGLSYLPAPVAAELREIWLADEGPAPDAATRFLRPLLQLSAVLVVEVALARLWMSWGVKPAAMIGHSMGEYAAAVISGVMSYESAVNLVRIRGELLDEVPPGGMLSVALPPDALAARLPPDLDIALVNAPELCVVSGPNDALDSFQQSLVADGIEISRIPIGVAGHSRMLIPILDRFEAFLRETPLSAPTIPIASNLTGTWLTADEARDPLYWRKHFGSTVRFADGLALLVAEPSRVFIEVGPGRTLGSLAKAQGVPANQVISSLPHAEEQVDDNLHFLTALGRVWATGLHVPLEKLYASADPRRVNLPAYAFQHQSYFLDRIAASGAAEAEGSPVKLPDIASWGWQPVWRQSSADVRLDAEREPASWLVFLDGGPIGEGIVTRLRRLGHTVATVTLGDAFGVAGEGDYVLCPEAGREGYDALVKHLASSGGLPQRIVHLWLATHDESFRPGSSFFHRNQERGFNSLFFLAQALSDAGHTDPLQITVVTNGMQRVGDEALPYPEKATVLGPAQVLPHEMPNVSVRVIDIPSAKGTGPTFVQRQRARLASRLVGEAAGELQEGTVLDRLWDDVLAENGNEIVAYRKGRRWTRTYDPLPLDKASEGETVFRERGVYLITGGLGELATAAAQDLARRFKARLVLVGRTALPDRSEWQDYLAAYGERDRIGRAIAAIRRIEDAGGEVMVARADITNSEAMQAVIEAAKARFGAIHGVLHAAGVVQDDLIALKTPSDVEEVFAPKVLGTLVLAELIEREPLDILILYSSTSTDTAPAGQVDYVAANAFLNAFAESRVGSSIRTLAVHWGVWKDVGLAARAIEQAEQDEAAPAVEAARTPLFDRHVHGARRSWVEARLDSTRQWVLDEHRLKSGQAIWPGTGYIELIAEALAEHDIDGPFEIEDLTFLRPLHVPAEEPRNVRVTLAQEGGGYEVAIDSEHSADAAAGLLRHAEARIRTLPAARPADLDVAGILARCRGKSLVAGDRPLRSAQEDHLRFGERWKVLRSVAFGRGEAMARLALSEAFVSDLDDGYLLHPALLDISTGYAMDLIEGYDSAAGLWVPMTYGRIEVHGALPAAVWSHARLDTSRSLGPGYATFDVTIADEQGRTLIEVQGFTIKQLAAGADLAASLPSESDAKAAASAKSQSRGAELSPALARLAAQVDQGILPEEGFEALLRAVGTGKPQVVVSSMELTALQRAVARDDAPQAASTTFDRPDLGVDFVEPQTEYERTLAGFWSELLGVKTIGVHDSFFDLGGHSLIAVRLFRMIKATYAVEFPISTLFEAPTIAQCAALIEKTAAKPQARADEETTGGATVTALDQQPRLLHLVRMDGGKSARRTPFFLCAGMFGNILNLRHLAVQIGADRPVYGLQARGIYGGQEPHETFEDMARDYLAEVRSVQPHGPYLLGGFSGGGLVAYEMAQQLRADGEETALVVMLDTPYPADAVLSIRDRIMMKMQDLNREGLAFIETWVRNRMAWERRRAQARNAGAPKSAEQFHNEEIEAAFRRALARYRGVSYDGAVLLMRPKQHVAYRISGGRELDHERSLLRADNGWTPFVADLSIHEVPGDHDSMVLEPNVRVLASYLRAELARADRSKVIRQIAAE